MNLSNLDLVASYVLKGDKSATMPATSTIQNDIIGPALSDAQVSLLLWYYLNYGLFSPAGKFIVRTLAYRKLLKA